MKRILLLTIIFTALLLTGAKNKPIDTIRLTIINKSEMDIAVQLRAKQVEYAASKEKTDLKFYYLPVAEGDRTAPTVKSFDIEKDTYGMQLYYIETWDPVYGFKCEQPVPNAMMANRDLRIIVLPCDETPGNVGEPKMRKYLPFPVKDRALKFIPYYPYVRFSFESYWITRLIY